MLEAVTFESDVEIPMRDGVVLRADIYFPVGDGRFPALVMRLPYAKFHAESNVYAHPSWFAARGYLVVVQDVRGRGVSDDDFDPFVHEAKDGYDTIEWVAVHPRCTGKVGMYGFSYVGSTQLLAASQRPPHLTAVCPGHTSADLYEGWTYRNGALQWAFTAYWSLYLSIDVAIRTGDWRRAQDLQSLLPTMPSRFATLPLTGLETVFSDLTPFFWEWLEHPTSGKYWQDRSAVLGWDVPTLSYAGWYDIFCDAAFTTFAALKEKGVPQELVVGPWWHMPWSQFVGSLDFGPQAKSDVNERLVKWLDTWCKEEVPVSEWQSTIRYFVMGENTWRNANSWPPAGTKVTDYFLSSGGYANSMNGSGALTESQVINDEPDRYVYNPKDPVPSLGGQSCCYSSISPMGTADQRPVETRNDVLVFTGDVCMATVTIAGQIELTLFAATSGDDADFTAKLVDVHPDGPVINLCDGIVRARYRSGTDAPDFVTPNAVTEYRINLGNIAHSFLPGHRIRLEVSSSNFPAFDRNPSTRMEPAKAEWKDFAMAVQTVYHDSDRPSRLHLPILSKGLGDEADFQSE